MKEFEREDTPDNRYWYLCEVVGDLMISQFDNQGTYRSCINEIFLQFKPTLIKEKTDGVN